MFHEQPVLRRISTISFITTVFLVSQVGISATPAEVPRFKPVGQPITGPVDWVSVDEGLIAFGSGNRAWIAKTGAKLTVLSEVALEVPIREAVFAGNRLYLNAENGLMVRNLAEPESVSTPIPLTPTPRGALHIARMDDYLLVAEDGYGLRILALPLPPGHKMASHQRHKDFRLVGRLVVRETFLALTSSVRSIYLLLEGQGLTVVNARKPDEPNIVREYPLDSSITVAALAANGPRVYLLGPEGLRILDASREPGYVIEGVYSEVRGRAIDLTGRVAYVADRERGLIVQRDTATSTSTHFVTVSDNVFTPANLTIELGDTVQWDNIEGFHNVESCDGASDPTECGGQVALEGSFTSGAPVSGAWTYSKTFNVVGDNPYFCVVHVSDDMVGTVTVQVPPVADHFVASSDFVFAPSNFSVNPGDVVQWDNVAGLHNVESCDGAADPSACGGQTAVEGSFFLPGGPTTLPWTFQRVFTVPGDNPYFCVVHATLGMVGNVTTNAALGPPGVPDGTGATSPLMVGKLDPGGSTLQITWDVAECPDAVDYQIIFGGASQLPVTLGGVYGLSGGVCSIGTAQPFIWTASPDPTTDSTKVIWFLVVANDGSAVEGSWGQNSGAIERAGPGAGGASSYCHASKDPSNGCGQ